jgi:hypothetical protein
LICRTEGYVFALSKSFSASVEAHDHEGKPVFLPSPFLRIQVRDIVHTFPSGSCSKGIPQQCRTFKTLYTPWIALMISASHLSTLLEYEYSSDLTTSSEVDHMFSGFRSQILGMILASVVREYPSYVSLLFSQSFEYNDSWQHIS